MAQAALRATKEGSNAPADRYLVAVHIDARDLQAAAGTPVGRLPDGELLPHAVVTRLLCDGRLMGVLRDGARPLDLGRSTRLVSGAQRRALEAVDGRRCRFPGCRHSRGLQAHHVRWWGRDGGPTDIDSLVLLCPRHHTVVHEQGFVLRLDPDRQLCVVTAEGRAVPQVPLPLSPGSAEEAA